MPLTLRVPHSIPVSCPSVTTAKSLTSFSLMIYSSFKVTSPGAPKFPFSQSFWTSSPGVFSSEAFGWKPLLPVPCPAAVGDEGLHSHVSHAPYHPHF